MTTYIVASALYMAGSVCFFVGTLALLGQRLGWWA